MVSIIIPLYNGAQTIKRTLDSIKSQTYKQFEIIIVNDGSTDDGPRIVENYKKENDHLDITLVNKENNGVSSARNAGMKVSKGDFIAFLDSDDMWLPMKLERQLNVLQKDDSIDFLASILFDPKKEMSGQLREISLKNLVFKNHFQPSTVLIKRKVYETVGLFNEFQRFAEEGNYFMRVASQFRCFLLYERLIVYGDGKSGFGESGLSANLLEMERGELMNLRFAYACNFINWYIFAVASIYSLMKYVRRVVIVKLRNI